VKLAGDGGDYQLGLVLFAGLKRQWRAAPAEDDNSTDIEVF
jgi:hypothetical protein